MRRGDLLVGRVRPGLLLAASLAMAVTIAGCSRSTDWVMFRGEAGRGATSNTLRPPLAVKWKLPLQFEGAQAEAFNPPVVVGDAVYFGSDDGNFYSLDLNTGYMQWIFKSQAPVNSVPFADADNLYFGSNDGHVYAVDRASGDERWRFATQYTVQSLILRYDDMVMFTSDRGDTHFLSVDGTPLHRIPNPVWSYHTFQVYEGVMYWAPGPPDRGASFGAFDIYERQYLWVESTTPGYNWYSFPALRDKTLFYSAGGSAGTELRFAYYAVNRLTGQPLWTVEETSFFGDQGQLIYNPRRVFFASHQLLDYMAPSLWRNVVVYTSGDAVVRAFDARTGRSAWRHTFQYPTSSAPTVAGDRVYFGVRGDAAAGVAPRLVALSARNGKLAWEMDLEGAVLSAPVVSGKHLIFGTDENLFYVLEEVF
jgi:outer membrane protein assembly factor BamB